MNAKAVLAGADPISKWRRFADASWWLLSGSDHQRCLPLWVMGVLGWNCWKQRCLLILPYAQKTEGTARPVPGMWMSRHFRLPLLERGRSCHPQSAWISIVWNLWNPRRLNSLIEPSTYLLWMQRQALEFQFCTENSGIHASAAHSLNCRRFCLLRHVPSVRVVSVGSFSCLVIECWTYLSRYIDWCSFKRFRFATF